MPVKRGEIYWVDLGIPKGSQQGGQRPALVIQNDIGNRTSPTTLVAAITSQKKKGYPFHVKFSAAESGLSRDGTVLLEQIRTINQDRLVSKAGELSSAKMTEVDQALKVSLGLI
jgi:mRNA interferase MazF